MTLEQIQHEYNSYRARLDQSCRSHSIIFEYHDHKLHMIVNKRIPCGNWLCPRCGKQNKKKFFARAKFFLGNEQWRLMTLTTRYTGQDPIKSLTEISHAWDIFLKRLKRLHQDVKFLKIIQFHKNGCPHLHILVNKFINQQWIKYNWSDIWNSYIVDIRFVNSQIALSYAMRYLGRSLGDDDFFQIFYHLAHRRRYSFSRFPFPKKPESDITILSQVLPWKYNYDLFIFLVFDIIGHKPNIDVSHARDPENQFVKYLDN